jgi:hypothetical protein
LSLSLAAASRLVASRTKGSILLAYEMLRREEQLKVLVVYYSFAGHTRTIAGQVAKAALADIEQLRGIGEPAGTGRQHYL